MTIINTESATDKGSNNLPELHHPVNFDLLRAMNRTATRFHSQHGSTIGTPLTNALADIRELRKPFTSPAPSSANKDVIDDPDHDRRAQAQAAVIAAVAWSAAHEAGITCGGRGRLRYFPQTMDAEWLADIPVPTAEHWPTAQNAALAGPGDDITFFDSAEALAAGYARQPRPCLFQALNHVYPWAVLVSRWIGAMSGASLPVMADQFESRAGDQRQARFDTSDDIVIQLAGIGGWRLGSGVRRPDGTATEHTLHAGDVLVVPRGVLYVYYTPENPGHSRHLVLGVNRQLQHETP